LDFDYEGKRDRWNGYDPAAYRHVVDDYQKIEEAKRQLKAQKMEAALMEGAVDESVAEVWFYCCHCSLYVSSINSTRMVQRGSVFQSSEPGELSQVQCHDDSTIDIAIYGYY